MSLSSQRCVEEDLTRLKAATNEAIASICQKSQTPAGSEWAIDWTAVRCTRAALVLDDDDKLGYEVEIEETSHNGFRVRSMVESVLRLAGWPDVSVVLEC